MSGYIRRTLTGTNYCGPGGYGETTGELDEACKAHDEDYGAHPFRSWIKNQDADERFLRRLASMPSPKTGREKLTKVIAERYFSGKINLHYAINWIHKLMRARGYTEVSPPKTYSQRRANNRKRYGALMERFNKYKQRKLNPFNDMAKYYKTHSNPNQRRSSRKRQVKVNVPKKRFSRRRFFRRRRYH